ncbi:hypothetical protein M407DRAFT_107818 [Tulasnella calospora MUT 4182]|uniref:Uncharacterized protein n=1 Tax=Tulasnella calospora MUT 4182 TaxID=1051891 RepID=A0A0C3LQ91_9AGAM|nr:hypothetical protein M407DRAFT_107818 [Tulasnella calospora MUT 4182]
MLKAMADKVPEFGVVAVRVLRPWNAERFHANPSPNSFLYSSPSTIFPRRCHRCASRGCVWNHRPLIGPEAFTPSKMLELPCRPSELVPLPRFWPRAHLSPVCSLIPNNAQEVPVTQYLIRPCHDFPIVVAQPFVATAGLAARLSTDFGAFSKAGGVAFSSALLPSEDAAAQRELSTFCERTGRRTDGRTRVQ